MTARHESLRGRRMDARGNVRFAINGKISGAEPDVPTVILGRYTWLGTEVDCGNEIPS